MKKFTIEGKEFECEKLGQEHFGTGACAFRVVDNEGSEMNWVVTPNTLEQMFKSNCSIETPADGRIRAFCVGKQDALMVASSINIASRLVESKRKFDKTAEEAEELARKLGFDIEAMKAEIHKLSEEGKSQKEIQEIMNAKMSEFLKDNPKAKQEGGEW